MRITIKTTYENCDEKWVNAYLRRLREAEVLPGSMKIANELEWYKVARFTSKDPDSDVVGTTVYHIEED